MENYEIYNDLINGRLDDSSAKDLFSRLASDYEQRLEFNSYISVSETIKTNIDGFQPSTALKNSIYAKAGVNMLLFDDQLPPKNDVSSGFWGSKLFTGIGSALLSGVVVYFLMQFVGFPYYLKNFTNSVSDKNTYQNKSLPVSDNRDSQILKQKEQKIVTKYIYVYKNIDKDNKNLNDNEIKSTPIYEKIGLSKLERLNSISGNYYDINSKNNEIKGFNLGIQNNSYDLTQIPFISKLSFEFGSSVSWNIPQETLLPAEINRFNNLAFTVLYDINEAFKIGVNVKQETFFTEYSGTEDIGSIYNYRQQPNLTTYSAVCRINPFDDDVFKPYCQISLGGNQSGIVVRPQLGMEIQPNTNLSFILGIDYSYFRFIHQNSWFNAGKTGINYGISYKF